MNTSESPCGRAHGPDNLVFHDAGPEPADLRRAVLDGLAGRPRAIPPKFFYDETGSQLFDAICELPEYYPTRTEMAILEQYHDEIAQTCGRGRWLVEPGSGSCMKVRVLLDSLDPKGYVPIDISGDYLRSAAAALAAEWPELEVRACCADFTVDATLPWALEGGRLVFFPGSSIGNYEPEEAVEVLVRLAELAGTGGGLLIGVDLKKDPATLEAAYDDRDGVTAAFNRNLLDRINRELEADFEPDAFEHQAHYDERLGRVEMHLVSRRDQTVRIEGHVFEFLAGESIHTENAYKYHVEEFAALAREAGFEQARVWTDDARRFSLQWLTRD